MRGAELIPDLSMIVHGLIIKWWLLWVKEIVGGYGFFGSKNKFASRYISIEN
jgi:hypothetical protein